MPIRTEPRTFTALFPFCGLGAGARGFLQSMSRLGEHGATFQNLGGIDIDKDACKDFEHLTGGPALVADMAKLTPEELVAFAGARRPDCVFLSPPCKGFSGLLPKKAAGTEKYEKLNRLVLQGLFLIVETWRESPPPIIVIENVPRIKSRGALLLAQVRQLLARYGYVFSEDTHDCGEIGGLGQHRMRYLMVARRPKDVPAYLYRPPRFRVKGCGEILGELPMPTEPDAGPLHDLPDLSWLNWVRLALIPAGGDWRDLPAAVPSSMLEPGGATEIPKELACPVPKGKQRRSVWMRWDVRGWKDPARTVAGPGMNGGFGVADPRIALGHEPRSGAYGVTPWDEPSPTVRGQMSVRQAPASVADPRVAEALALPENANRHEAKFRVTPWTDPTGAVTGARPVTSGGPSVADPRIKCSPRAGYYGVISWDKATGTITGTARVDNGAFAVADPRTGRARCPIIVAADGTWHRPLTLLELAALQGLPARVNGKPLKLAGKSSSAWRERIGNAVPVQAARAIGESILTALLASALGTWTLGSTGIWVRKDGATEDEANAPFVEVDREREIRLVA